MVRLQSERSPSPTTNHLNVILGFGLLSYEAQLRGTSLVYLWRKSYVRTRCLNAGEAAVLSGSALFGATSDFDARTFRQEGRVKVR